MTKFTATEAYEASNDGEPIMITKADAAQIIGRHDVDKSEGMLFLEGCAEQVDAWSVLEWLGY